MNDTLLKFFPVPKYLTYPLVGIDISDDHIRFVELAKKDSGLCLSKYGRKDLLIMDKDDEEQKLNKLASALLALKKEEGFKYASVSLPEEHSFFFSLVLPILPRKDIKNAIELRLQEYVPYSPEEVVFDYQIYSVDEKKKQMVVGVALIPMLVVNDYSAVLHRAKIKPLIFEPEAIAAARVIVPKDNNFYMVINIGTANTTLSVVSNEVVWLSNTVKIGGKFFDTAIKKRVDAKSGSQNLEILKQTVNLRDSEDEISLALIPIISSIRDEISKYYKFWHSHKTEGDIGAKRIKKVFLCGSQAGIKGLDDYLSASLGFNVERPNPWSAILSLEECVPDMEYEKSLGFVTSLGLAFGMSNPFYIY